MLVIAAWLALTVGSVGDLLCSGGRAVDDRGPVAASGPVLAGLAPPLAPLDPRAPGAQLDDWSARELRTLPGLGRARATLVADERRRRGGSLPLEAFLALPGLGARTVEGLRRTLEAYRAPSEPEAPLAGDPPGT